MAIIRIENLCVNYPTKVLFHDVNIEIEKGDRVGIIGNTGSGKSTLLRCINGLTKPTSGNIYIRDELVTDEDYEFDMLKLGMRTVLEQDTLFENKTILENYMMVLTDLYGYSFQDAYNYAMDMLAFIYLSNKADCYPRQLTKSEQQRVAINRSTMVKTDILLLDNPTTYFEPFLVQETVLAIKRYLDPDTTVIVSSSDLNFLSQICNKIVFLNEGTVYDQGTVEEILINPTKPNTKHFVLHSSIFQYFITEINFDFIDLMCKIQSYGKDNHWTDAQFNAARSVVEEVLMNGIIPNIEGIIDVEINIEYDSQTQNSVISFLYNGGQFDALEKCDEISKKIVLRQCKNTDYIFNHKNYLLFDV